MTYSLAQMPKHFLLRESQCFLLMALIVSLLGKDLLASFFFIASVKMLKLIDLIMGDNTDHYLPLFTYACNINKLI